LWLLSSLWASIICAYQCGIPEFCFSHLKDSDFLIEGCQVSLMNEGLACILFLLIFHGTILT
jgi:hypothetical protein